MTKDFKRFVAKELAKSLDKFVFFFFSIPSFILTLRLLWNYSNSITFSFNDRILKDNFYFYDDEKIVADGIEVKKSLNKINNKKRIVDDSLIGIKLMSDSNERLTVEEIDKEEASIINMSKRKRKLEKEENFDEILFKCRNVAVEPESVLSKLDTKVWTEKQKGVIYRYKKFNDGTIIEIN